MEEIVGRWRNILVFGAKHGENAPAKKNVPENATKSGETTTAEKNVLKNATIPGENVVAVGKHPCFGGKTGRKCRREGKMS